VVWEGRWSMVMVLRHAYNIPWLVIPGGSADDGRGSDGFDVGMRTKLTLQSGSTPRRPPRSDRPTLDLVSESSSRTVTCGSPSLSTVSHWKDTDDQHRQAHRRPLPSTN
jgi:hypothetical protein